jgi:UTP--glucose-1-phosphate uridylyltransferase
MAAMAGIRKAVFPAAGLGTRFLPATKVLPKEMLILVDKPVIQYGIEEAARSGIESVVLVTGHSKSVIEDHFGAAPKLEAVLADQGKLDALEEVRAISGLTNLTAVQQGDPLGLGHAVLVTQPVIGDEPFAVILSDDVMDSDPPALKQMIDVYHRVQGPVIAVERVPDDRVSNYGIVTLDEPDASLGRGVHRIRDLVEKPPRDQAPSNLGIIGRYILTPDLFPHLEATGRDSSGEIQLTNALRKLLVQRPLYACEVDGVRHDTGHKLGFLKATAYFALKEPDLAGPFRAYLKTLDK